MTWIDAALASDGVLPRLPRALRPAYADALDRLYRRHNRFTLVVFAVIFDLFLISQFRSAPELVTLSAWLRLAVFTPAVGAFLLLDRPRRPLSRRRYALFLLVLAVAPAIMTAMLCLRTTSTTSMPDVRATTLILLSIGLILRMPPPAMGVVVVVSVGAFLAELLLAPVIPRVEIPSLALTELAVGAAVIGFGLMLDRRDRLVFLLRLRDEIQVRGMAHQNRGLRQQAEIDALTGQANRRCFDAALQEAWDAARLAGTPLSLVMIDIDHFKRFNDHYGHPGGDSCLRRVAQQARREIREGDLLARYGGEEFAVILPRARLSAALRIAERMRAAVEDLEIPHAGVGEGCRVSISLGVASAIPVEGVEASFLVESADRNLYAAKRGGRNRVSSTPYGLEPTLPAATPEASVSGRAG